MSKNEKYRTVSINPYWIQWMDEVVATGIRRSRAEIVVEGLKSIQYQMDRNAEEVRDKYALAHQEIKKSVCDEE